MPGVMPGQPAYDGACAVNKLAPEVVFGASSDAAASWLAPGGILSRHQPDPRCHLTARANLAATFDRGDDRGGVDRADAGQLREPTTRLIRATQGQHVRADPLDP